MKNGGSYPQTPKAELLEDGRIIRLLEDFVYIDPNALTWTAPRGARADGASIPRLLWPLIGGPFEGRYRNASIIHDFYCSKRHKPWNLVHRMFFDAMITSGVSLTQAKLMYAGVYMGGPRWSQMDQDNTRLPALDLALPSSARRPTRGTEGALVTLGPRKPVKVAKAKTRTAPTKPKSYRYTMGDSDLGNLLQQAKKKGNDLDALEAHVDGMLTGRKPRTRGKQRRKQELHPTGNSC